MLCTLAQFKARFGIASDDTDPDTLLGGILLGVSAQLARAAGRVYDGRPHLELAALTAYLNVPESRTEVLWLPAWPVVSITSIKEALYGDFASATALTVNDDYQLQAGVGALYRVGYWLRGVQTVQVVYTVGYTPPTDAPAWVSGSNYTVAGGDRVSYLGLVYDCIQDATGRTAAPSADTEYWTVAAGEIALPDDLVEAALQQCGFCWQRRDQLGLTGMSAQGGSVSAYAQDKLLPGVREIVQGYRRCMG